jgi:sugar lactone lactonase YvrE
VFFVRALGTQPWLFRGSLSGSEPQRIGDGPLPSNVLTLSPVSPDGSTLIATARLARWLIALPSGSRRQLMVDEPVRTQSIAWFPDSRYIVVADESTSLLGFRLSVQDTRSAARRLILQSPDPIDAVSTSIDGTRVVYAAGPTERDLVEFSGDGRFIRTIAASSLLEGFPTWSRAGDRFVYRVGGPGQSDSLWLGTADGGSATLVQRLTSNVASQTPISPDGGRIAYVDPGGVQVVSVSGGPAIRALSSATVDRGLCWSPDGEWLWYSEGPTRLGKVPSRGGAPVIVDAPPGILLDCSADTGWLVRIGRVGLVLTAADGKAERLIAPTGTYAGRTAKPAQFGGRGTLLYLLGLDRQTVDVLDVGSGKKLRTVTFDLSPADQIEDFSFSADGARVLLTTGGDRKDVWMAVGFARPAASWRGWFTHWEAAE